MVHVLLRYNEMSEERFKSASRKSLYWASEKRVSHRTKQIFEIKLNSNLLQAMGRRPGNIFLQWISIALFLVMRDPPTVPFLAKAATRSLCYHHRAEELGKDDIDDVLVHTRACIGTWLSRDGALAIFSSLPTSLLLSRHTSIPQRTSSTYSQQQNTDTVVVESSQFPDRNCWWVYYTTLLSYYICGGVVA